jgi:hypothetical protein
MQNLDVEAPAQPDDEKVGISGRGSFWRSVLPKSWQRDRSGFSRLDDQDEDGSPGLTASRPSGTDLGLPCKIIDTRGLWLHVHRKYSAFFRS